MSFLDNEKNNACEKIAGLVIDSVSVNEELASLYDFLEEVRVLIDFYFFGKVS